MQIAHSSALSPIRLERVDLALVLAVAETGGVTRAGARLHLSQSALSRRLLDLEGRVGAPLFRRAGRRMISTALGDEICRRATEVERSFAQAEASLRRAVRAGWRTVRVTPECYTGYHWLPTVLGPLKREFPEVDVRLVPEATREPELALRAGRIDIAIVTEALTPKKKAVKQEELFSCPLFDDELVVALAPEHPLAREKFVQPEDFLNEHLLVYDPRPEGNLFRLLIPAGVRPAKVTVVPLTEATVGLVKAGVGIAVLARWALTPHLVNGTIQGLPLGPRGLRRRWRMLALADDVHNSDGFVRRFVELLRAHGPIAESK